MSPALLLALYCGLILLASLAGGWIPSAFRLTHVRMQVATSFVAGLMLGVAVLHLLPHAWHELESIDLACRWLLGGFLLMFFILRFFHFHHHDVAEEDPGTEPGGREGELAGAAGFGSAHDHGHSGGEEESLARRSASRLSWGGVALGLTLHTLIDGIALAASVRLESHADEASHLMGAGTFLVIILHKPFDAMAIATLMAAGGWSRAVRHWVNGAFSLMIPVGVLLFYLGAGQVSEVHGMVGASLAFAAGTFLCIAASDLLPELQFHSHDRIKLSMALLLGVALAAGIGKLESSGHDRHHHDEPAAGMSD